MFGWNRIGRPACPWVLYALRGTSGDPCNSQLKPARPLLAGRHSPPPLPILAAMARAGALLLLLGLMGGIATSRAASDGETGSCFASNWAKFSSGLLESGRSGKISLMPR